MPDSKKPESRTVEQRLDAMEALLKQILKAVTGSGRLGH
jgi:hypothetical protein